MTVNNKNSHSDKTALKIAQKLLLLRNKQSFIKDCGELIKKWKIPKFKYGKNSIYYIKWINHLDRNRNEYLGIVKENVCSGNLYSPSEIFWKDVSDLSLKHGLGREWHWPIVAYLLTGLWKAPKRK